MSGKRKKKKEGTKKEWEKQPKTINRVKISTFLSISTLNTNGLNAHMTKSDWMDFKKERSIYLCSL